MSTGFQLDKLLDFQLTLYCVVNKINQLMLNKLPVLMTLNELNLRIILTVPIWLAVSIIQTSYVQRFMNWRPCFHMRNQLYTYGMFVIFILCHIISLRQRENVHNILHNIDCTDNRPCYNRVNCLVKAERLSTWPIVTDLLLT